MLIKRANIFIIILTFFFNVRDPFISLLPNFRVVVVYNV